MSEHSDEEYSARAYRKKQQDVVLSIFNIQKTLIGVMAKKMLKENSTPQQMVLLAILTQEGPLPMNRLSQELFVTPSNITGIIDRLEEKQFVKRVENSKDRRKTEITITDQGKKVYQKNMNNYMECFQESLDVLTEEEQEMLSILLRKLAIEIVSKHSVDISKI